MSTPTESWVQPGTYHHTGMQMGLYTTPSVLKDIAEYENFHDGDCMVASYPKTGTTLTQEIVYLIYNNADLEKAKAKHLKLRCPFMEFVPPPDTGYPNGFDVLQTLDSPKLVKTHLRFEDLSKAAHDHLKIVYVVRNPKDMLVSYYHFYRANRVFGSFPGNFSDYLKLFYENKIDYGNYFDHLRSWTTAQKEKEAKILIVKYEDLLKNKKNEIKRIAEFLQKSLSDEAIQKIVDHTAFAEMKQNPTVNNQVPGSSINPKVAAFMRKGEIGDWKNHFTVADNEMFDEVLRKWSVGSEIPFQYE